jgi:regulator of nucleoside diphosphate kinase
MSNSDFEPQRARRAPAKPRRKTAPPPVYVTEADRRQLMRRVGAAAGVTRGAALLSEELERAVVVRSGEFPERFVKLGSSVTYEDVMTGRARTVRLVLPEAADIDAGRVSVFTPVGAALLGLTAGQAFAWDDRRRVIRILEVVDDVEPA